MYADDILLISDSEENLQNIISTLKTWCDRWRMVVNIEKTQIVHFRNKNIKKTEYNFKCGAYDLRVVEEYKYLGIFLNEHLDFSYTSKVLAKSGSRALTALINRYIALSGMHYKTYSKLFDTCVIPILDTCPRLPDLPS